MPRVEIVMSRSPMASRQRLPSSARSWPLVVCQKNGSKLSKPRSAISAMRLGRLAARGADHGADADGFGGIAHVGLLQTAMSTRCAGLGALDRGEDHGEALDVVGVDRQRVAAGLARAVDEVEDHAGMALGRQVRRAAAPRPAVVGRKKPVRRRRRPRRVDAVVAVPQQRALGADDPPGALPAGRRAFGAPRAAIGEHASPSNSRRSRWRWRRGRTRTPSGLVSWQ